MGLCLVHCDFTPGARLSFLVRDRDSPLKSQASPQKSNIPEAESITKCQKTMTEVTTHIFQKHGCNSTTPSAY